MKSASSVTRCSASPRRRSTRQLRPPRQRRRAPREASTAKDSFRHPGNPRLTRPLHVDVEAGVGIYQPTNEHFDDTSTTGASTAASSATRTAAASPSPSTIASTSSRAIGIARDLGRRADGRRAGPAPPRRGDRADDPDLRADLQVGGRYPRGLHHQAKAARARGLLPAPLARPGAARLPGRGARRADWLSPRRGQARRDRDALRRGSRPRESSEARACPLPSKGPGSRWRVISTRASPARRRSSRASAFIHIEKSHVDVGERSCVMVARHLAAPFGEGIAPCLGPRLRRRPAQPSQRRSAHRAPRRGDAPRWHARAHAERWAKAADDPAIEAFDLGADEDQDSARACGASSIPVFILAPTGFPPSEAPGSGLEVALQGRACRPRSCRRRPQRARRGPLLRAGHPQRVDRREGDRGASRLPAVVHPSQLRGPGRGARAAPRRRGAARGDCVAAVAMRRSRSARRAQMGVRHMLAEPGWRRWLARERAGGASASGPSTRRFDEVISEMRKSTLGDASWELSRRSGADPPRARRPRARPGHAPRGDARGLRPGPRAGPPPPHPPGGRRRGRARTTRRTSSRAACSSSGSTRHWRRARLLE